MIGLGVWSWIKYYLFGRAFYAYVINPGVGLMPFYALRCRRHGLYLDYPQGNRESFWCPECSPLETRLSKLSGSY